MPEFQTDISVVFNRTCNFVLYQIQHVIFILVHTAQILVFDGEIILCKCMRRDVDAVVSNAVRRCFRQRDDILCQYIFYREYLTVFISGFFFSFHLHVTHKNPLSFCDGVFPVANIGRICGEYVISVVQGNKKIPRGVRIGNFHCTDGQYPTRRTSDPIIIVFIVQTRLQDGQ